MQEYAVPGSTFTHRDVPKLQQRGKEQVYPMLGAIIILIQQNPKASHHFCTDLLMVQGMTQSGGDFLQMAHLTTAIKSDCPSSLNGIHSDAGTDAST